MKRAAPVEEPCEEGSVYFFLKVPTSPTFVIGNKAEWLTLQGISSASSNGSVLYIGVVGEELLVWGCGVGSLFEVEPLDLAFIGDDSSVCEVDSEARGEYLVHVLEYGFDEGGLGSDIGCSVLCFEPGLGVAWGNTKFVEEIPYLETGGHGRFAPTV